MKPQAERRLKSWYDTKNTTETAWDIVILSLILKFLAFLLTEKKSNKYHSNTQRKPEGGDY